MTVTDDKEAWERECEARDRKQEPTCVWCSKPEAEHTINTPTPTDALCLGDLAHCLVDMPAGDSTPKQLDEYRVHLVQLRLCEACLAGLGKECHTPGCALWLHDSPGFRIIRELYEIISPEMA